MPAKAVPPQFDVIGRIAGYRCIIIVDARGCFDQLLVKFIDLDGLTIISHREQERSNVALMGYRDGSNALEFCV